MYIQETVDLNNLFSEQEEKIDGKIYRIVNLITEMVYIGQTIKRIDQRWHGHIYNSQKDNPRLYLHKSIKKYGVENFIIEQIDFADNIDTLNQKEIDWIIKEDCIVPNGYNMKGGGGSFGKMPEFLREKISRANKGKTKPASHSERMSKLHSGKKLTPEHKQRISEFNKGKKLTPEHIQIIIDSKTGKSRDEKTKRKISNSLRERYNTYHPKHYHNPITGKAIYIDVLIEELPEGFIPGRVNVAERTIKASDETRKLIGSYSKNTVWYYDAVTGKNRKFKIDEEVPANYMRGLNKKNDKQINQ
jgi:group I intron endonuclease